MKKFKHIFVAAALLMGVGLAALPATPVSAINVFEQCNHSDSEVCKAQDSDDATSMIQTIINIMLFLLGAIAVIMIVIGGLRYVTSGGDASSLKSARDTILYAVIGLVIAVLSYAIVNFVLGALE